MKTATETLILRHLTHNEIALLSQNGNVADSWDDILVTDDFCPKLVKNSRFEGSVSIGALTDKTITADDIDHRVGIYNSVVKDCHLGDNVSISNVRQLAGYHIGDDTLIANVNEMVGSEKAKPFTMALMNENGGRTITASPTLTPADAYLWTTHTHDKTLTDKLEAFAKNDYPPMNVVGKRCAIKNTLSIHSCNIGDNCHIHNAISLTDLIVKSSEKAHTTIGDGTVTSRGIVGYGCHISTNAIAERFVMGENCKLEYGARLIDTMLGDNSTIECCEVRNSLIFNAHEQHHNNSFLIAACLMGQSNVAAGATLGSNHNSRAADGEILAGRGFWPGLCTSVKHSSRFAPFTLLAKADYPYELDIKLPFSLVSNDTKNDQLNIMPAYWWMYNMYALVRNSEKFKKRDKRTYGSQHIEFGFLAPDTIEDIVEARKKLEISVAEAYHKAIGDHATHNEAELTDLGKTLLNQKNSPIAEMEITAEGMEKSRRKVLVIKVCEAYKAYGDMLLEYAIDSISSTLNNKSIEEHFGILLSQDSTTLWTNLGGQVIKKESVETLIGNIKSGTTKSWGDIHDFYDWQWESYANDKAVHAAHTLKRFMDENHLSLQQCLLEYIEIQDFIYNKAYQTREKDYQNPFRKATFANDDEMTAVIGQLDENQFLNDLAKKTEKAKTSTEDLIP